jgi:hypothetical protein
VKTAVQNLLTAGIRHLPVVRGNVLVGMVADRDLRRDLRFSRSTRERNETGIADGGFAPRPGDSSRDLRTLSRCGSLVSLSRLIPGTTGVAASRVLEGAKNRGRL